MTKFEVAREWAERTFGSPLGWGRNRVVFRDGDTVLKIPKHDLGSVANDIEHLSWDSPHEPRAQCSLDDDLTERFGIPVLRMEYVEHVGLSEKPDWTWSVDCGQVGRTRDGRIVAYDWEQV